MWIIGLFFHSVYWYCECFFKTSVCKLAKRRLIVITCEKIKWSIKNHLNLVIRSHAQFACHPIEFWWIRQPLQIFNWSLSNFLHQHIWQLPQIAGAVKCVRCWFDSKHIVAKDSSHEPAAAVVSLISIWLLRLHDVVGSNYRFNKRRSRRRIETLQCLLFSGWALISHSVLICRWI